MLSDSQQFGRYRIEAKIGEGGAGIVYRAFDTEFGRTVAIKVLRPDFSSSIERRTRFTQEARTVASLRHPHIVTIFEIGNEQGLDFICMEHLEGETLEQRIRRRPLDEGEAIRCAIAITGAAGVAHQSGIVHRDLKPANIFLTVDGGVKLLDFGLAKLAGSSAVTEFTATKTMYTLEGQILGTVLYMSPEQAEGRLVDARSDIFSFGAVLYEMITGRPAFDRDTSLSTLAAILREAPPQVREIQPAVSEALAEVIGKCLEKSPGRRFTSMRELCGALEAQLDVGSGRLVRPPSRRWIAGAKTAAALLAGFALMWWASSRVQPADIYLVCLLVGFGFSVVAAFSGSFHLHVHAIHDGGLPGPGQTGAAVISGFNFGTAAAFVAWFGGSGYVLTRYFGLRLAPAYGGAVAAGLIGAVLVYLFVAKVLMANDRALHPADYELAGVTGRLSGAIREAGGTGEMIFSQAGTRRAVSARSASGVAIARGARVVVIRHEGGIAYVNATGNR